MILVVDDDKIMGESILRVIAKTDKTGLLSSNAIEAIEVVGKEVPEMVFLDVFLTGPDGFTFLNEMASYADTAAVPVVIVSEKDFSQVDLKAYGVVGALDKNTMVPEDIADYIKKYTSQEDTNGE